MKYFVVLDPWEGVVGHLIKSPTETWVSRDRQALLADESRKNRGHRKRGTVPSLHFIGLSSQVASFDSISAYANRRRDSLFMSVVFRCSPKCVGVAPGVAPVEDVGNADGGIFS
jgi:hypothetical protein